jgi:hypothetical protein
MAEVPMKLARITLLLALCLMLVSCGGSSGSPGTINGNWSATLSGTTLELGTAEVLTFTATLNQTSPPAVDVTNFVLGAPCFSSSNAFSTFSSGAFTLHVVDSQQGGFQNKLDLQGNLDGRTITGNWTLTGGASQESCTASGTFKMTRS